MSDTDPWGVTTLDLFELLEETLGDPVEHAVATVIRVDGSAYRRPGAKMILGGDGSTYGGITAGCLEGPLQKVAQDVIAENATRVVTFDLTDDEDGWGLGLGCEGIVDVLVEPADGTWTEPVDAFHRGESRTLVTAIDGTDAVPTGSKAVLTADGSPTNAVDSSPLPPAVLERVRNVARERAKDGKWCTQTVETAEGSVELFVDGITPPTRLLVFGGQPDVRPVTRLARDVGLHVTVATARGGQAEESAFPRADRVVSTHPSDLDELVDERTYPVVMSHNFVDDRLALETLLETPVPFIGLMGPRERFQRLRDDLEEEGVMLSTDDRERIATPVGLELGGGEPVEIALSIVSEVIAVSNDKSGGRLRDRDGPIHERPTPQSD
ncbi:XdhC/CoxI family protein [Halostagnicola sp. A-GB9-2]|uniref:XdhC family protein n=1 Tax=Halostagnicola sp. A-GB9-2 TaxID=3048066 RepID=UPI0024C097EA|nr:XdhC/CoxI family protein [Halostagnicola sp. A-GB9-2]MDJ1433727.1 XdhC family protein [Halostagnicola sp. A-GB9-2]